MDETTDRVLHHTTTVTAECCTITVVTVYTSNAVYFPYAVMASMDTASSLEELHFMNIPPLRLSNVAGVLLKEMGNRSTKKFS